MGYNNVFISLELTEGQHVQLTRISRRLRQVDLACLAKCTVSDVVNVEKDRYVPNTRKDKILAVLGLKEE